MLTDLFEIKWMSKLVIFCGVQPNRARQKKGYISVHEKCKSRGARLMLSAANYCSCRHFLCIENGSGQFFCLGLFSISSSLLLLICSFDNTHRISDLQSAHTSLSLDMCCPAITDRIIFTKLCSSSPLSYLSEEMSRECLCSASKTEDQIENILFVRSRSDAFLNLLLPLKF